MLTPDDINELDKRVDATIPSLPLLARRRDIALINLLRYFDSYAFGCAFLPNTGEREIASHYSTEGLHHAVRWVNQFCKPHSGKPHLKLDLAVYAEATELLTIARSYAKVWQIMSMLHRGILQGRKDQNGVIHVAFASEINKQMDMAEQLIATPYDPEVYLGEPIVIPEVEAQILQNVKIRQCPNLN